MPKKSRDKLLMTAIAGRTVQDWDARWERVPNRFKGPHATLAAEVGLARVLLAGQTMYVLRATELGKGGIQKGLRCIAGPEQTGNQGYGAQMIRQHIDQLELEVLRVGSNIDAVQATKRLKKSMIELHDPEWNRAATRRIQELFKIR